MIDKKYDSLDAAAKILAQNDALTTAIERQDHYIKTMGDTVAQAALIKDTVSDLVDHSPAMQAVLEKNAATDAYIRELSPERIEPPITQLAQLQESRPELFEPTPAVKTIAQQNRRDNLSGLQRFVTTLSEVMGTVGRMSVDFANSPLVVGAEKAVVKLQQAEPAVMKFLNSFNDSPIVRFLEKLASVIPDKNQFNRLYLQIMYEARWFPYTGDDRDVDPDFLADILEVIDSTRRSKTRTKKIDKIVFDHYTKARIESIRKSWRTVGLPNWKVRMLNEAIRAFHRKEYASSVNTLITTWEGLIQEKVNDDSFRMSRKTRENMARLVESNGYDEVVASFCKEFIFYKCESLNEVIEDVPGRHGIAHSWFDHYPSRKVALNAIMFTDFLLKLNPLSPE